MVSAPLATFSLISASACSRLASCISRMVFRIGAPGPRRLTTCLAAAHAEGGGDAGPQASRVVSTCRADHSNFPAQNGRIEEHATVPLDQVLDQHRRAR